MDQGMNSMEVKGEEKRDKRSRLIVCMTICLYDNLVAQGRREAGRRGMA
jgi:hypothetical protein